MNCSKSIFFFTVIDLQETFIRPAFHLLLMPIQTRFAVVPKSHVLLQNHQLQCVYLGLLKINTDGINFIGQAILYNGGVFYPRLGQTGGVIEREGESKRQVVCRGCENRRSETDKNACGIPSLFLP